MKSSDFLTEQTETLTTEAEHTLPATFVLPDLKNQDAYLQYRFGLALASARAVSQGETTFHTSNKFGENMAIVARSAEEEETLAMALKLFGSNNKAVQIASSTSQELPTTFTTSPVPQNSGKKINRKS